MTTRVVCVKVSCIRPRYNDLQEWIQDTDNIYIGRRGVVFIMNELNQRVRYPPQGSKYANRFKVVKRASRSKYECQTLYDCLKRYETWLRDQIDSGDITLTELRSLRGKNLGCWCHNDEDGEVTSIREMRCHGDVLKYYVDRA